MSSTIGLNESGPVWLVTQVEDAWERGKDVQPPGHGPGHRARWRQQDVDDWVASWRSYGLYARRWEMQEDSGLFGEMRSLFEQPAHARQETWGEALLGLAQRARQELGAEMYVERWLPHLARACERGSWPVPLCTLTSLEALDAAWECLPHARFSLEVRGPGVGDEWAESPQAGCLTHLRLQDNKIGSEARAIAASAHMAGLTELSLANNDLRDDGVRALAASPNMAGLTRLKLRRNRILEDGGRALAGSVHMASLTYLDLSWNRILEAGACALAGSANMGRLTYLNLSRNNIREEGA